MVQRPHTNQRVCNESVSLGLLASSPLLSVLARSGSFLDRDLGPWLQFVLKQSDPEQATSHLQACVKLVGQMSWLDTVSFRATLSFSRPGASPGCDCAWLEQVKVIYSWLTGFPGGSEPPFQAKHWLQLSKAPASEGGEVCPLYPLEKE